MQSHSFSFNNTVSSRFSIKTTIKPGYALSLPSENRSQVIAAFRTRLPLYNLFIQSLYTTSLYNLSKPYRREEIRPALFRNLILHNPPNIMLRTHMFLRIFYFANAFPNSRPFPGEPRLQSFSIVIAASGHTVLQLMQPTHLSVKTGTAFRSFISKTLAGQYFTQYSHPLQNFGSTLTVKDGFDP